MPPLPVAALSAACLLISAYVFYSKRSGRKLRCMIGKSCDIVTGSRYAVTFGVENSLMGMIYYSGLLLWAALPLPIPAPAVIGAALVAALFSAYLTWLQLFVIREMCDWCMVVNISNWAMLAILLLGP
ncbi:MAG: vitamin K epoxide reductase family protein [Candidatus Micrarchaeota archaeon]